MNNKLSRTLASTLLVSILATSFSPTASASYNDMEEITSHVQLKLSQTLQISRPEAEFETSEAAYFIAGSSNPSEPLTMNGEVVSTRGAYGSFGVYVTLEQDNNTYVFQQGTTTQSVVIKKGVARNPKTTILTNMAPSYSFSLVSQDKVLLSCDGPSGATVSAQVNGKTVKLKQKTTSQEGTAVKFEGVFTAPAVSKDTKDLGSVTYSLTYNGKTTTYKSEGNLYVVGDRFVVQVINNAASIYDADKRTSFVGVARLGAVDYVTATSDSSYKLSSGGWIPKDSVKPVSSTVAVKNKVSQSTFKKGDDGESLILTGTSHPMYRAVQTNQKLTIKLMNTTGVKKPNISGSSLFSAVNISEKDGATTLEFTLSGKRKLWGYDVSYKNGVTSIYTKYKPKVGSGNKPLANATIVLDPGHGGNDPGAIGIPGVKGAVESDINYAAAVAAKKRLEKLGAEVILTRSGDETVSLNERMAITQKARPDLFLAIHSNSIGYNSRSNSAQGVESYYYEDISKKFATAVNSRLVSNTGRTDRGAKFSNFRVTMQSFCPAVLMEMGFISNAKEYDKIISKDSMFQTANAIADAAIAALA